MNIEQFTETPENTSSGALTNTAGLSALNLDDIQNLNEPMERLRTVCPDGSVVFHDTRSQAAALCGQTAEADNINETFGDLTIEDSDREELTVASNTKRRDGNGGNSNERDARLDRLLS